MQSKTIATLLGDTTTKVRDTRTGSNSTKHKCDPSRGRGDSEGTTHAREANRQIKNATPHADEVVRKARDSHDTHKSCAFDEFRCATPHADEVFRKARHSREKHIDKSRMRPLTQTKWFGGHDTRARIKLTNHERNPSRGRGGSGIATFAQEAERQMEHATPPANEVLRKARHSHEKQIYPSRI